ncbi:MAG: OmpA family protein [Bdellovibrionota bacterium]
MRKIVVIAVFFLVSGCVWKSDFEALQAKQRATAGELDTAKGRVSELETEKAALQGDLERTTQELQKKIAQLEENLAERQKESQERLQKMADDLDAAKRAGSEQLARLQSEYDAAKEEAAKQISQTEQDLAAAREQAQSAQEKVKKMTETYDSLVDNLQDEIKEKSVRISKLKNNLRIDLVDKILFDSGSDVVNERGKKVLAKVSNVLKNIKDRRVVVEGHTDNVPIKKGALAERFPTNWELSAARAVSVVRLLEQYGVPSEKLSAAGYSEYRPIASNSTDEGKSQNRRIEIQLQPLLEGGE